MRDHRPGQDQQRDEHQRLAPGQWGDEHSRHGQQHYAEGRDLAGGVHARVDIGQAHQPDDANHREEGADEHGEHGD